MSSAGWQTTTLSLVTEVDNTMRQGIHAYEIGDIADARGVDHNGTLGHSTGHEKGDRDERRGELHNEHDEGRRGEGGGSQWGVGAARKE